jgi:hypothetical protein
LELQVLLTPLQLQLLLPPAGWAAAAAGSWHLRHHLILLMCRWLHQQEVLWYQRRRQQLRHCSQARPVGLHPLLLAELLLQHRRQPTSARHTVVLLLL